MTSRKILLLAVGLLTVHVGFLLYRASIQAITPEETRQIMAGLAHWHNGNFRLACDIPPLPRLLSVLPVLAAGRPYLGSLPYLDSQYVPYEQPLVESFAQGNGRRLEHLAVLARLAGIAWSVLGGWLIFRWTRELYGSVGAVLSLTLWCLATPVFTAATLSTHELAAAVAGLAASYASWRFVRQPTWNEAGVSSILLGVALLTHFLWLFLLPAVLLLALAAWRRHQADAPFSAVRRIGQAAVLCLLSLLVIPVGYRFQDSAQPFGNTSFFSRVLGSEAPAWLPAPSDGLPGNRLRTSPLGSLVVPVPADYLRGLDRQLWALEKGDRGPESGSRPQGESLWGAIENMPWGLWGVLLGGLFLPLLTHHNCSLVDEGFLWFLLTVPVVWSAGFSIRHVPAAYAVIALPFLCIAFGKLPDFFRLRRWEPGLMGGTILCLIAASSWDDYQNRLAATEGKTSVDKTGYPYIGNMDHGSDLLFLKDWLMNRPEFRPLCSATRQPAASILGENSNPPPPNEALPGFYGLDVSNLALPEYAYFRFFTPVDRLGHGLFVYHITLTQANRVRRQQGLAALTEEPKYQGRHLDRGFLYRADWDAEGRANKYVLFVPHEYEADKPYPLIVFLHGYGDYGEDGLKHIAVGLAVAIKKREKSFPFLFLFPLSRGGDWSPDSPGTLRALKILDLVQQEYHVDRKRVYVTGASTGGAGTWEWAGAYPDRWAAIVPVASASCNLQLAPRIQHIPCWCFHASDDLGCPVTGPRQMIQALRAAGGRPRYSEYPGKGGGTNHNVWDQAYGMNELYEWLLQQHLP